MTAEARRYALAERRAAAAEIGFTQELRRRREAEVRLQAREQDRREALKAAKRYMKQANELYRLASLANAALALGIDGISEAQDYLEKAMELQ